MRASLLCPVLVPFEMHETIPKIAIACKPVRPCLMVVPADRIVAFISFHKLKVEAELSQIVTNFDMGLRTQRKMCITRWYTQGNKFVF